jgi:CheY-like chemotaxis protein/glycine cleavage system H lipoate-binding protein
VNFDFDILVIDDEPVVLAAAKKILEPEGFSMDEAATAERAMRKLKRFTYRMVLCDLKLPGEKGWELIDFAREHLPSSPVVMITGYATVESAVQSFKFGAFDFLPKPFDVGELLGVVSRALSFAESSEVAGTGAVQGELYALGLNAWANLEPNGTARIGMGESFAGLRGRIRTLNLPAVNEEILQGRRCARIVNSKERVHTVWAPLSGRVVETNSALTFGSHGSAEMTVPTWLVRIVPSDLEDELLNLSPR